MFLWEWYFILDNSLLLQASIMDLVIFPSLQVSTDERASLHRPCCGKATSGLLLACLKNEMSAVECTERAHATEAAFSFLSLGRLNYCIWIFWNESGSWVINFIRSSSLLSSDCSVGGFCSLLSLTALIFFFFQDDNYYQGIVVNTWFWFW